MSILVINVGSSSVRLATYDRHGRLLRQTHYARHHQAADELLRQFVSEVQLDSVDAIGHRIVHGGNRFSDAVLIDAQVERVIDELGELAPLHNPPALEWIRLLAKQFPLAPQVAVFDTAFYADLPDVARTYAIPYQLQQQHGLRRFGFHGIAHRAMCQRWLQLRQVNKGRGTDTRVISLQLGSGCSITASRGGHAVDTSMGYSPLEGLMMATRAGDVDAGLVLYLQRHLGYSIADVEGLLDDKSGLLGVSGVSSDMKEVLGNNSAQAHLAVELYCYRARKYIGAYLAVLGGADAILFGGGVGEHSAQIRAKILAGMQWAGICVDEDRNAQAIGVEKRIDAANSAVEVYVVPVDEAAVVLTELARVLKLQLNSGDKR